MRKCICAIVIPIILTACGGVPDKSSDKKFSDNRQRIVVENIVLYVWPTSRENYVRVQRSETEATLATPKIVDLLDYQDRFLAEAARKATGCDVDLDASSLTERICLLCTPQYYARLQCSEDGDA